MFGRTGDWWRRWQGGIPLFTIHQWKCPEHALEFSGEVTAQGRGPLIPPGKVSWSGLFSSRPSGARERAERTVDVARRSSTDLEFRHKVPDHVFGDFRVLADQRAELDTGDHKEVNVGQGPQVGRARRVG